MPALRLADFIAPTVSLGHAFGRFGNFMNGDAHGYPLRSQWLPEWLRHFPDWMGVTFPLSSPAGRQFPNQPLHPVMLYELVLNLLGFCLLWGVRKRPLFTSTPGRLLGLYLIYYAAVRSFTSLFRADDLYLGVIRMPHVISVVMALIGLLLLLRRSRASSA
jgi:phosphatidylglycerol:prolipoprotein diacylglycerol transferase